MITPEQKIEVVDELLGILDKRGWTQMNYENSRGEVCMLGAFRQLRLGSIGAVYGDYSNIFRARGIVEKDLQILVGSSIATWNDRPWRSYASVKRKLRTLRRQYEREIRGTREYRLYDALAERLVIERGRNEARQSEFAVTPLPPFPDVTQDTTPEQVKTTA